MRTKAFPGADVSRGSTNADGTRVGEEIGLVDLHINIWAFGSRLHTRLDTRLSRAHQNHR